MQHFKQLLLPIQIIYFIIIWIRNILYDFKILPVYTENVFIISVGNIKNGGTGKTPMVEYIINLFNQKNIAVLSRGYRRKTSGFILAKNHHTAKELGDESYQLYKKFKNTIIACDNNRVNGVRNLIKVSNKLQTIILDDGFQHRKINRDIDILLTEYDHLFSNDKLMPIGQLREYKHAHKRADIIVITKCPKNISPEKIDNISRQIQPTKNQKIYFSYIKNNIFRDSQSQKIVSLKKEEKHILVTGIANPQKILDFLENNQIKFQHVNFTDHYDFSKHDIANIIKLKINMQLSKNLILTEKDFYRLTKNNRKLLEKHFNLITIELEIDFIKRDKSNFKNQMLKFEKSKNEFI